MSAEIPTEKALPEGEPVSPEVHPAGVRTACARVVTIAVVTRDAAIERVSKLREISVERGATRHEAATALALAAGLTERYGLARPVAASEHVARYRTSATADRRSARSLRFVALA